MQSTDANAPSSSGAVEAPVQTPTLKRSPRALASVIRRAKAVGTAFGYPAPVNPLIPTLEPGSISAAASSADITLSARPRYRMCERSVIVAKRLHRIEHHDGHGPVRPRRFRHGDTPSSAVSGPRRCVALILPLATMASPDQDPGPYRGQPNRRAAPRRPRTVPPTTRRSPVRREISGPRRSRTCVS
jgi:hypothetical protein